MFSVFRRSRADYLCYQEALHEHALQCRDRPEDLLTVTSAKLSKLIRHPVLEGSYYQELYQAWPAWQSAISPDMLYEAYFSPDGMDVGTSYWKSLVGLSDRPHLFQECRTSCRVASIRKAMGGLHIYLWRNPWDQWWSCKVANYFEIAMQMMINASHAPRSVQLLREDLRLERFTGGDVDGGFEHFRQRPLKSDDGYMVFYLLWCLALKHGLDNADLLLNIDHLSQSVAYRDEILASLGARGLHGLDLSDCEIPQTTYSSEEVRYFRSLEDRVHDYLLEGEWSEGDIARISEMRMSFRPSGAEAVRGESRIDSLIEQASRARALALQLEDRLASASVSLSHANDLPAAGGDLQPVTGMQRAFCRIRSVFERLK